VRRLLLVDTAAAYEGSRVASADALLIGAGVAMPSGQEPGLHLPHFALVPAGSAPWHSDLRGWGERLAGVALDGAEPREIERAAGRLAVLEAELDRPADSLATIALAGSPASVLQMAQLTGSMPRLRALVLDQAALCKALGVGAEASAVRTASGLLVLAAHAAGVPALLLAGPGLSDEGFASLARAGKRDGFSGLVASTPAQLALAAAAFQ
jgi:citrate lyase beta subunit